MMKAKYGKLSIGCFIVYVAWCSLIRFLIESGRIERTSLFQWVTFVAILLMLPGIAYGVIGAVKKELPRRYFIIGLWCNVTQIIPLLFGIMPFESTMWGIEFKKEFERIMETHRQVYPIESLHNDD